MFSDARESITHIAPALVLVLAHVSAQASGFPVSLDDYLPQNVAPSHVYMQPDGTALVASGNGVQLSLHRLDRDPSTPSYSQRFVGSVPSVLGSFEQQDGSFWAHRMTVFLPPSADYAVSYWRMDPSGHLLQFGSAIAPLESRVFELSTGFYAISPAGITNLESAERTSYALCSDVVGGSGACSLASVAAATEGFWAVRRLLEAPGLYRFEALRFNVQGQLQETQTIPGSYSAPAYAQFWRHSNLLRFAVHGTEISLFNMSDLAGWQIVQAGSAAAQNPAEITPLGAGDWLVSTRSEIAQYTPVQFSGTLVPLSARYRSRCESCTYVRSTAQGEVLAGRKSAGGYFKWLTRDGLRKLEQQGVYDAYFARDDSVLVLAPDDPANPRRTRAHWFGHDAQPLITEYFSLAPITPWRTELFEGKNAQILAVADSMQSSELPIYRIDSAGVRVRVGTSLPSRTFSPSSDSQAGSGYVHRQIYVDSSWFDVVYESTDSESGEQFKVLIESECAQAGLSRFIALGAAVFDFQRCTLGFMPIRHIQAGKTQRVGAIFDYPVSELRTHPALAGGDELRVLTRHRDQPGVLRVHGLSAAGLVFRYQHLAANNATPTLLADGSLLVAETVGDALKVRRVWQTAVFADYPMCGSTGIADTVGNVWSFDASTVCHTTPLGVLSKTADVIGFGSLLASNGDLIARNISGRCVRLHPHAGQLHARAFGDSGLCFLPNPVVLGENLYVPQRRTVAPWSTEPDVTVLLKQSLPSVAEVVDTVFYEGFE